MAPNAGHSRTIPVAKELSSKDVRAALGWNRVGGASRPRPPTPPYILVVYGGFFNVVTHHILTTRETPACTSLLDTPGGSACQRQHRISPSIEHMRHKLAGVRRDGRARFPNAHSPRGVAFFVPDRPTANHRVHPLEALHPRRVLVDEAFGAVVAASLDVVARLVQGDVRALAPQQRLPHP